MRELAAAGFFYLTERAPLYIITPASFRRLSGSIQCAHMSIVKEDTMALSIGDRAPDFELPITMEETWKLSENLHDRSIVLLFFPLAYSSTCHKELCSIRDGFNEFRNLDATIIAVSVDNPFVLGHWKDELGLPFELLSDFNKTVSPEGRGKTLRIRDRQGGDHPVCRRERRSQRAPRRRRDQGRPGRTEIARDALRHG
jgi:peroxiredoxin